MYNYNITKKITYNFLIFSSYGCVCLERCKRKGPQRFPTKKLSRIALTMTPAQLNR